MVRAQEHFMRLGVTTAKTLTGGQTPTEPDRPLLHGQLGKPSAPHRRGSPTVRKGDGAEGRRGRNKRMPPGKRADRAAHLDSPNPKGGRLPSGPDGRERQQRPHL